MKQRRAKSLGFTLVELAIVLAIAGLLFAGLWRLLAGGNQQLKDTAAASQQEQLITSVKAFLASSSGQAYMANNTQCGGVGACSVGQNYNLPLPAAAGTCGPLAPANMNAAQATTWCNMLPPGFAAATANSYGQTYSIKVQNNASSGPGAVPTVYSFMITTAGGDTVPDSSGGRISAQIGGDGGFRYSTATCGSPANAALACGAYGAWTAAIVGASPGYSLADPGGGHVVTRTYISPEQDSNLPWLARLLLPGDTAATPTFNTMTTDLFLGGKRFFLGTNSGLTTGGGEIDAQGGKINMQTGALNMNANGSTTGGGNINLQNGGILGTGNSNMSLDATSGTVSTPPASLINLNIDGATTGFPGLLINTGCSLLTNAACTSLAINVPSGDVSIANGQLTANTLFAGSFIYSSSDARLKMNIHPLQNPLDDIMKLNPVSFAFKSNKKPGMGVIAQELETVYPQLVQQNQGTKFVNYEGLIGPLIGAVQELKRENDELRRELKSQAAHQQKLDHAPDAKDATP